MYPVGKQEKYVLSGSAEKLARLPGVHMNVRSCRSRVLLSFFHFNGKKCAAAIGFGCNQVCRQKHATKIMHNMEDHAPKECPGSTF